MNTAKGLWTIHESGIVDILGIWELEDGEERELITAEENWFARYDALELLLLAWDSRDENWPALTGDVQTAQGSLGTSGAKNETA